MLKIRVVKVQFMFQNCPRTKCALFQTRCHDKSYAPIQPGKNLCDGIKSTTSLAIRKYVNSLPVDRRDEGVFGAKLRVSAVADNGVLLLCLNTIWKNFFFNKTLFEKSEKRKRTIISLQRRALLKMSCRLPR